MKWWVLVILLTGCAAPKRTQLKELCYNMGGQVICPDGSDKRVCYQVGHEMVCPDRDTN